jgi:hypothetical protein
LAEYKREIGAAVTVAVVLAVVMGMFANYYFSGPSLTGGTTTNTITITGSRTLPPIQTYTSATAPPDPSLAVSPIQGLLQTSTNASAIAESLASQLNELPIYLVSQQLPTCSGNTILCTQATYLYRTAAGSNITVTLIQGEFYELAYITQDYWELTYGNATSATGPAFSTTQADGEVQQIMNDAFGVPLQNLTVVDQFPPSLSPTDYVVQWVQGYDGVPIASSVVYFEFYPPTSELTRMIIIEGTGWYQIPSDFPLSIQASTALSAVEGYAANTLHMSSITYTDVSLQVVDDQMYYAVTVSNYTNGYILFVNPRTGEIGFPQP